MKSKYFNKERTPLPFSDDSRGYFSTDVSVFPAHLLPSLSFARIRKRNPTIQDLRSPGTAVPFDFTMDALTTCRQTE